MILSKLRPVYVWLSYYKYDFRLCNSWKIRFQTRQFGHQWSCQNTCWVQLGHVSSALSALRPRAAKMATGLKLENYNFFTFTFSRPEVRKLLLFYVFTFSRPEVRKLLLFYVFTFSRPEVRKLLLFYVFIFSRPEVGKLFHISMA